MERVRRAEADLAHLGVEVRRLRALADARLAALERYGEHDGDCPAQVIVPRTGCALGDCTPGACGLDAALEDK